MRTEEELDFLENHIPDLAQSAVQKAYLDSLSNGNEVIVSIDNALYRISPNGKKEFIKNIAEDIQVDPNKKLVLT